MTQPSIPNHWYEHNLDPIAFTVNNLPVAWYWLVYVVGWFWCDYIGKKWIISKTPEKDVSNQLAAFRYFMLMGWILLILCARLGYVFFYNLSYYMENPTQILAIWNGGMSFHGGFIGIVIAAILTSKRYNISIFVFTDVVALAIPMVLFFGRLANFMNGELAGRASTLPWAVVFPPPYNDGPRHPSPIYEALLEGLVVGLLLYLGRNTWWKTSGRLSIAFMALYATARFIAEFFREPDRQIGMIYHLTLGQWLSVTMLILAAYIFRAQNRCKIN